MAFSPVATYAFVGTNYNKVSNGDWTRYPVLGGQCCNAIETTAETVAKKSSSLASIFTKSSAFLKGLAESNKVFNGVSKTVDFVKRNINPLIVASGVTKVVLAKPEDREKTFYSEGGMIGGMLLGEGWMKKNLDAKVLKKLPIEGRWAPVVKGTLFVAGSLTASAIGQKAGQYLYDAKEKNRLAHEKEMKEAFAKKIEASTNNIVENQTIEAKEREVYEPLELKA